MGKRANSNPSERTETKQILDDGDGRSSRNHAGIIPFTETLTMRSIAINLLRRSPHLSFRVQESRRIDLLRRQSYQWIFSSSVERKVKTMMERHDEIMEQMSSAGHTSPSLGKELSSLTTVTSLYEKRKSLDSEEVSLRELMKEASELGDDELSEECQEELDGLEKNRIDLDRRMIDAVLPKDEDDYTSDAIIEIRAGTGGVEASLFAAELLESYKKTAQALKWKVELLSESKTDLGGVREATITISGRPSFRLPGDENDTTPLMGPYGVFKFESGGHRVQRVPINDSKIHTSACAVGVLPSVPDSGNASDTLPLTELKIETMRSSGAGGQHVNSTDSAVRITHLPTGMQAAIQDERSQHQNKAKALMLITARVRDRQRADEEKARGETRSGLMGGGDRGERIRTYNFPQDRITDHRCKHSEHGISILLNGTAEAGNVVTFLPLLKSLHRDELMEQFERGADNKS
jgi:peptide chain release factor 1